MHGTHSTCTRALALLLVSDVLLPERSAGGALIWEFENGCHTPRTWVLAAFTRWDAAYFLLVARNG